MANIEIFVTSPASTIRSLTVPPRRLSIPAILQPPVRTEQRFQARKQSLSVIPQEPPRSLAYHLHTLLLFTYRDIFTILLPQTCIGLVLAVASSQAKSPLSASNGSILLQLPQTLFWIWVHLLFWAISNQSQPGSVIEDGTHKPWRPLPAGRITYRQARCIFWATSAFAIPLSHQMGVLKESLQLMVLFALHNDLGLGDHAVTKNLLNGLGYYVFGLASAKICVQGLTTPQLSSQSLSWLAILSVIVFVTVQVQDLEDQEGDRASGRRTVPIIIGDGWTRLTVLIPVLATTILAPQYWNTSFRSTAAMFAIGAMVVKRLAEGGDEAAHKKTYRLYLNWLMVLYVLPLFAIR